MYSIFSLISVIVILIVYVRYKLTFWKRQGIPNDITHSYRALQNVMSLHDMNCIRDKGKIVGTYELLTPTLLIAEPKLIHQILVEDFQKFSSHRQWITPEKPMGQSLSLLDYKPWKQTRQLLSPVFTTGSMKKINYLFKDSSDLFIKNIHKYSETGQIFDIRLHFEAYVMDVLFRAFFATNTDSANETKNPLVMNSRKIFMNDISFEQLIALLSPKLGNWLGFNVLNKDATDLMTKIIQRIINERMDCNKPYNDLLQILIESKNKFQKSPAMKFDDKQIIDNCILFMIGGFDTTSSTLTNLTYYLVKNPSVQENIIKELDEVLDGKEPNSENIKDLIYMKACIDECLRIEPSVVRTERKTVCDCKLGNIFVPKDTYITIPLKAVHRDPENFENPDEFKPERFLPENKHLIKSGTYLGFADGPRNCIGMRFALIEMILILAELFSKYRIFECSQTEPIEYYCGQFVAMPKKMMVKIEKRMA